MAGEIPISTVARTGEALTTEELVTSAMAVKLHAKISINFSTAHLQQS